MFPSLMGQAPGAAWWTQFSPERWHDFHSLFTDENTADESNLDANVSWRVTVGLEQ